MNLIRRTAVLATALIGASAFAAGPVWNNIAAPAAPTVNIYQQPDYAANVSNGFSKMADALRQYEAAQPTPKPGITYSTPGGMTGQRIGDQIVFPDGVRGVFLDDKLYVTNPAGAKGVCDLTGTQITACQSR